MRHYLSKRLVSVVLGSALAGLCLLIASCVGPRPASSGRGDAPAATPYDRPLAVRGWWREKQFEPIHATLPTLPKAEYLNDNEICATCHEVWIKYHEKNIHRKLNCEDCHGPGSEHVRTRGQELDKILSLKKMKGVERNEICLKCHEQDSCGGKSSWRTSAHAHANVSCEDCHKAHYNVPPGTTPTKLAAGDEPAAVPPTRLAKGNGASDKIQPVSFQDQAKDKKDEVDMVALRNASQAMGAKDAQTCYRCHQQTQELERIAHPHQIHGPNGFECKTCHDPHGRIRPESRAALCLQCHKDHMPTLAWKSSAHAMNNVACVDCHNPHPSTEIPRFLNIRHFEVEKPKRLPMAVQEPDVCYPCHQNVASKFNLPSHHPLQEGKMVCGSCHDPHGNHPKNLIRPTINLLCYKCHAEKQGPFVYEHPPVSENCAICHDVHGTVANNLLRQPTTFLCLRCHAGHHGSSHSNIDKNRALRAAFYTDCTQCHAQVHGGNLPTATRKGSRLQR